MSSTIIFNYLVTTFNTSKLTNHTLSIITTFYLYLLQIYESINVLLLRALTQLHLIDMIFPATLGQLPLSGCPQFQLWF